MAKYCEFKLYCQKKEGGKFSKVAEQKYNMSVHIGQYNQPPVEIMLTNEIRLIFQLNILPACPVLHKALFQAQAEAEAKAATQSDQSLTQSEIETVDTLEKDDSQIDNEQS